MARLKVLYPGNHTSSGNIGADVENIVRYKIVLRLQTKLLRNC